MHCSTIVMTIYLGLAVFNLARGTLEILESPSSLLLPIHSQATLTCRAQCVAGHTCTGHWLINGSYSHTRISHEPRAVFLMKGFQFPEIQRDGNEYTLTLRVNASAAVNNTTIQCEFDVSGTSGRELSTTAEILVILDSPLSVNPAIEKNDTHITLLWSPPFLWPAQSIQHFVVSVINNSAGVTSLHRINTTHGERIVAFTLKLNQSEIQDILTCTEMTFTISAFAATSDTSLLPQIYNMTEIILPPASTVVEILSSSIQTKVYYGVDKRPAMVEVSLQVIDEIPESSYFCQNLNYTITFENTERELIKQVGPFQYYYNGGFEKQLISVDKFLEDETYFLCVHMSIAFQTFTSDKHQFNTSFISHPPDLDPPRQCENVKTESLQARVDQVHGKVLPYQIGIGISSCAFSVLMFVVASSIFLLICRRKRKETKIRRLQARLCDNVMIQNPIYEGEVGQNGPVYEVIHQQSQVVTSKRKATNLNSQPATCGEYCSIAAGHGNLQGGVRINMNAAETTPTVDDNTVRYTDYPVKLTLVEKREQLHSEVYSSKNCMSNKKDDREFEDSCLDQDTPLKTCSGSQDISSRYSQSSLGVQSKQNTKDIEQYICSNERCL